MMRVIATGIIVGLIGVPACANDAAPQPVSITDHTKAMQKQDGFIRYYWDDTEGKIWLEIDRFDSELLYVNYLSRGLGSNDVGLDRGQIGGTHVVYFHRIGPRVLMMERNYGHRSSSGDPQQEIAVSESFARSTLWGFRIAAAEPGRVLVDATDFLLRDARDVIGALARRGQGRFSLDADRSAIDPDRTRNFPENTEFEAILTYTADTAGLRTRQVAPTATAITLGQHHSFVALPDDGFRPRTMDPRSGFFGISYVDHAAALGEPDTRRYIMRHRLEKVTPGSGPSEVVEPIVYYVDRGAPEPMRSALIEGASWWSEAFEAAGFLNAFRVELLPENADPLDVRYNVIQWVHRATRGWSYGSAIMDPRTGEAIKGHVTLGSLRARQDYLIAEGILGPYGDKEVDDARMNELALARLRQLACHEVGHTLGLRHNFAASTQNRASVMDYPYPYVTLGADGSFDLSEAYASGVGPWDVATIRYGYQEFAEGVDEDSALVAYVDQMTASELVFLSDADARPAGGAHPEAHLWDNGANAIDELERLLPLRARMLDRFSARVIRSGTPLVMLEEALVPIYMFHRYQLEAVPKFVGGVRYRYSVRNGKGDGQSQPVSGREQRRALKVLIETLDPSALILREELLRLLPPQTIGLIRPREIFDRRTGAVFDLAAAAESVADIPIRLLLHPERAAGLEMQHAADDQLPDLGEVIDVLISSTWQADHDDGTRGLLQRTVDNLVLHHLFRLANTLDTPAHVRAIAYHQLERLLEWLRKRDHREDDSVVGAHFQFAVRQIERFFEDPGDLDRYDPVRAPAGSPIGSGCGRFGCSGSE